MKKYMDEMRMEHMSHHRKARQRTVTKYLVVRAGESAFLNFADGAVEASEIDNVLKYPATDNLNESIRQLQFAPNVRLLHPKIVKVLVTFEDVGEDELDAARDKLAKRALEKLSPQEREHVVEYLTKSMKKEG
jgi:hypothetical protein